MGRRLPSAIIACVVVGALLAAGYQAWQRRPSAVGYFNWGSQLSGGGVLNAVASIDEPDSDGEPFSYYTGARSGDVGPLTAAPTRILAVAEHGSVSVRLLGFDGYEHAHAAEDALELARIASAATTRVFPGAAIPVEIDLHFMPEGARFSLAKRVDWRDGRPYALAAFTREQMFETARTTVTHELYHVLARASALRGTPDALRRPRAANSFEEAVAPLYAACGQLLADRPLAKPQDGGRVRIVDADRRTRTELEGVLDGEELATALAIIASDGSGANIVGDLLARTALEHVFGEADTITLDSPQGMALLALCNETAPNPFALEAWLLPAQVRGSVTPR